MDKKKTITAMLLTGLLALFGGMGVSDYIVEDVLVDVYVCDITLDVQFCPLGNFVDDTQTKRIHNGISRTAYTCYPNTNSRADPVRCRDAYDKGEWVQIEQYAEQNGINLIDLLVTKQPSYPEGVTVSMCHVNNTCTRIV